MKKWKVLFAIGCGLIVAACGGGGGGDSAVTPADFSGTWNGSSGGTSFVFSIVQTGSNFKMTRTTPALAGTTYSGAVNGNSALVTTYINGTSAGTSTLALTNNATATMTVNTCTPPQGYSCAAPGTTITIARVTGNLNTAPVANAGSAQSVVIGTLVNLDGSASSDANGDTLTYSWALTAKPAGSTANVTSTTSVNPTFTADLGGTYVASLTVNDGRLNSATATVSVTATATPATAYEQEFNDDYAHANLFFIGQKMLGSLSSSSDVDWFAIDINNYNGLSTLNFEIPNNPGFGFWNVYFFDPDMQALAGFNVSPSAGFSGLRENIPTFKVGRYYVRVRADNPSFYNGSGYSVTVTSPP